MTEEPISSAARPQIPDRVEVDDAVLTWRRLRPSDDWPSAKGVLEEFLDLASAQPDEMGQFLEVHGVPELCHAHGLPDFHEGDGYCPLHGPDQEDWRSVSVRHIRQAARAFAAIRRSGQRLAGRQLMDATDWQEVQMFVGSRILSRPRSYQKERDALAAVMTDVLTACRVRPRATWPRSGSFTVANDADGLIGILAILLAQEIGRGEVAYRCTVCGREDPERLRRPRDGEAVYCKSPKCKREQQRRNQATWRARKLAEEQS